MKTIGTMSAVARTEILKLRRSAVPWLTLAAYLFMGLVVGLMLWMVAHPGVAASLGLLGQKASISTAGFAADWPGLLAMFAEMSGIGGMIVFSIIVSYVFGREYAEGTAKNILGLPIERGVFVAAKLIVAGLWFAVLTLVLVAECLGVGFALGLPGFSWGAFLGEAGRIILAALLTFALGPSVAWVAMAGSGYLAPLGYMIFTLVLGTIFGVTAWAPWVPWSIVPLYSGLAGPRASGLAAGSWFAMLAFFALTAFGAESRFRSSDNCQ